MIRLELKPQSVDSHGPTIVLKGLVLEGPTSPFWSSPFGFCFVPQGPCSWESSKSSLGQTAPDLVMRVLAAPLVTSEVSVSFMADYKRFDCSHASKNSQGMSGWITSAYRSTRSTSLMLTCKRSGLQGRYLGVQGNRSKRLKIFTSMPSPSLYKDAMSS